MAGKLTTHVLDTAHGQPAVGMKIVLSKIESTGVAPIKTVFTNSDGRTDDALLEGNDLLVGTYELMFYVGDYYAKYGEAESPVPRRRADPFRHRQPRREIPRAAAVLALGVFDVPRKLKPQMDADERRLIVNHG